MIYKTTPQVLIVAAKANMIQQFNTRNIAILQGMGFVVHVATNFEKFGSMSITENEKMKRNLRANGVVLHQIDFGRRMGTIVENWKAFKQMNSLLSKEKFDFMHVHSPLGGVIGRMSAFIYRLPVVYTVHGFHFFKGGPIRNWLFFYPLEYLLAWITNAVVTINNDDEKIANSMPYKNVFRIWSNGSRVSESLNRTRKQKMEIRVNKRTELHLNENDFVILSIGELSSRKNQKVVLEALANLSEKNIKITYLIVGVGEEEAFLRKLAKQLGIQENVKFLGYRNDVHELNIASDLFVFPSLREGLGIAGLDAVVDGTYIIASNVGGIKDYVVNDRIGELFSPKDSKQLAKLILKRIKYPYEFELEKAFLMRFDESKIDETMSRVYRHMSVLKKGARFGFYINFNHHSRL